MYNEFAGICNYVELLNDMLKLARMCVASILFQL